MFPGAEVMKEGEKSSIWLNCSDMNSSTATSEDGTDSILASLSDAWYLKHVTFDGRQTRIITQNFNGSVSIASSRFLRPRSVNASVYRPCSFIAICMVSSVHYAAAFKFRICSR